MASPPSPLTGALLGLAAFGLYAGYDATVKFLGASLSPVQILFCAGAFSLPMLLAQLWAKGQAGALRPRLPRLTLARVAVTLVNGILGAYAFANLPLAEAYAVFFLMPLLIAALAVPILGEPMDLTRGLAILAGLAGVTVALRPGVTQLGWGHLAALAAAMLGALNYLIIRRTSGVEQPGVILLYPTLAMVVATGAALPWLWQPMDARAWGLTFLMGVELFVGGFFIIGGYARAPAIVVAPMQYSQILWAALFGHLIFAEAISRATWAGILVIVAAGLVLLSRSSAPGPARAPDPV